MFKKALQTLACLLLASPLSAFDVSMDGVEFGVLQRAITETSWSASSALLSDPLVLNEGDVLKVLRWDYASNFTNNKDASELNHLAASIYSTHGLITSQAEESDYIVGPAIIQVGFGFEIGEEVVVTDDATVVTDYGTDVVAGDEPTDTDVSGDSLVFTQAGDNYAQMDYAILRKGASTQSSYMTIPANSSGNFEVKLQTSTDLQTWTPTTTGIFNYGDNTRFFRLVVE
jgi:hypothetical protein